MEKNPFYTIFESISSPTKDKPWGELKCNHDEKAFAKDFVDIIDNLPCLRESDSPFFFRGQSNHNWTLKPKLYRLWDDLLNQHGGSCKEKIVLRDALSKEYDTILYFQERAFKHLEIACSITRKLTNDTFGEWLALMQHYNSPTRLLDWTTSFYVALYFAVQDDNTDGAVWFFGKHDLEKSVQEKYATISPDQANELLKDHDSFVSFGTTANSAIYTLENNIKTDRIVSQRGVFTFSTQLFNDHAVAISSILFSNNKQPLIKLIIPSQIKKSIRKRLCKINITNETLFVSIDSIGKTINEKIQLYQDEILRPQLEAVPTLQLPYKQKPV